MASGIMQKKHIKHGTEPHIHLHLACYYVGSILHKQSSNHATWKLNPEKVQHQKQKEEDDEYEIRMTIGLPCNL